MKQIYIAKSPINGNGTFAGEDIKKGEFIGFINGKIEHMINKTLEDSVAYKNWYGFKKDTWIDPLPPFDKTNHSCDPNCGIRGTKKMVARKNIKKGEELTIDYAITEMDPAWYITCTCGSKLCRKKITPIQTLSKSLFLKYAPDIPTYFMNYYKKYYLR